MIDTTRLLARNSVLLPLFVAATIFVQCPQALPDEPKEEAAVKEKDDQKPFPQFVRAPSFEGGLGWLNTAGPIEISKLKGKIVLLDFWTYCCINCIHILPDLARLEAEFPNELVVIGVHSAKFTGERDSQNIRDAVMRYEIKHPVVNDGQMHIWQRYGVNAWPTRILVDPEGYVIGAVSGEGNYEAIHEAIKRLIEYHGKKGTLDRTPLHFQLESYGREATPLRYPGKVAIDKEGNRLIIADSGHHRLVVIDLKTQALLEVIGNGKPGLTDGPFEKATFNDPQGMAVTKDAVFVADRRNHVIRKVDFASREVSTIAGTGRQGHERRKSGPARESALASPWALLLDGDSLYIAMAGTHQIWKMDLAKGEVGPFAGSGAENIYDGDLKGSAFAQPSGLALADGSLYVADSETSAVRKIDLKEGAVETVIGRGLFDFGDVDGNRDEALLQHALGVAVHEGHLYIADTYNNKIKTIELGTGYTQTFLGDGKGALSDAPPRFDEPGGLAIADGILYVADTNNHAIRVIDLSTKKIQTIPINKLAPPKVEDEPIADVNASRKEVSAIVVKGESDLSIRARVPVAKDQKLNPAAPMSYRVSKVGAEGEKVELTKGKTSEIAEEVGITLSGVDLTGIKSLEVAVTYFPCEVKAEGVCRIATQVWSIPISTAPDGQTDIALAP